MVLWVFKRRLFSRKGAKTQRKRKILDWAAGFGEEGTSAKEDEVG
jgi:hypothetical protein